MVIAWFAVEFVAIHPFQDGNGRLARVLTTLLLLSAGLRVRAVRVAGAGGRGHEPGYYRALRDPHVAVLDEPTAGPLG